MEIYNHKLHWKPHIESMCSEANKILGFIRQNLRGTTQSIKEKAYKTIVRPCVEYASHIWDPPLQYLIDNIGAIQKTSAQFVLNHPHYDDRYRKSSTTAMVRELNWDTLLECRKKSKVSFMYKVEHDLVEIPPQIPPNTCRCPCKTALTSCSSHTQITWYMENHSCPAPSS